ncbi:FecR domain-containing protein [Blastomonas sp.]|uniref:FecR family protein n=1 Tax=Blastomonas sp. TaxID=1909299 RepID=UPI00260FDD72|nr:FecR domain-containing protein [Blastomonas sp.]MDM7958061.1 FecR domain-containing protein [Blastomonas sp.]
MTFSLLALAAQPAFANIGRVKQTAGTASIERKGARVSPVVGTSLLPGDVLVTGKGGQIAVTFADNTRFAVGPNSRVAVDTFDFDRTTRSGAFETRVEKGSLGVVSGQIAKSRRDAMKVRTPTSLLGVRGTRFIVNVPD